MPRVYIYIYLQIYGFPISGAGSSNNVIIDFRPPTTPHTRRPWPIDYMMNNGISQTCQRIAELRIVSYSF